MLGERDMLIVSVTAVPAVTAAHPGRIDHVFGANTSGKVQLWTSAKSL